MRSDTCIQLCDHHPNQEGEHCHLPPKVGYFILFYIGDFIYLFIFRQRGKEEQRDREKRDVQEKEQSAASRTLPTRACALTGNRTGNLSFHRPALNPLSHTSQGGYFILKAKIERGKLKAPSIEEIIGTLVCLFWPFPCIIVLYSLFFSFRDYLKTY